MAVRDTISPALVFDGRIQVEDNSTIMGYNSLTGAMVPADLRTNANGSRDVSIVDGSRIIGDLIVGPGADLAKVLEIEWFSRHIGSAAVGDAVVTLPPHTFPGPAGGQDVELDWFQSDTIEPGSYRRIRVEDNSLLVLEPGTYVVEELDFEDGATLLVNGPVEIFVEQGVEVDWFSSLNRTGRPNDLKIYTRPSERVRVEDNSLIRAVAGGPGTRLALDDGARFDGSFIGERLDLDWFSRFRQDRAADSLSRMDTSPGPWRLEGVSGL